MSPITLNSILISITIYCLITYIETLIADIINENNNYYTIRAVLSLMVSILIGVIYFIH